MVCQCRYTFIPCMLYGFIYYNFVEHIHLIKTLQIRKNTTKLGWRSANGWWYSIFTKFNTRFQWDQYFNLMWADLPLWLKCNDNPIPIPGWLPVLTSRYNIFWGIYPHSWPTGLYQGSIYLLKLNRSVLPRFWTGQNYLAQQWWCKIG